MKKKNKIKIATLKYQAYKLRANYQIPLYLAYLINKLDGSEELLYVKYLMECSMHFMRIKNYYKRFKESEKESEKIIKDGLFKLGYQVLDIKS